MAETLSAWFVSHLGGSMAREALVFIVSLLPLLELRGGILVGYALGMDFWPTFLLSLVGNILPIPFILLFLNYIFQLLRQTPLGFIVQKCEEKAMKKSESIQKYAYWGIFLFVAIPLPGTGAWTGALIAILLGMNRKKTFCYIIAGILAAGLLMSLLSFGVLDLIGIGGK